MVKTRILIEGIGGIGGVIGASCMTVIRTAAQRAGYIDKQVPQVAEEWLHTARVVGITSGASAPEELVQRLVGFFRARGTEHVEEFEVLREDVRFMLPKTIRQAVAASG